MRFGKLEISMPKKVTKQPKEGEYTTVKLPNDLAICVDQLIGKHGFKSRGEIVKEALRDLLKYYEQEEQTRFEHFNMGANGVRISDRKLRRIADINFKPTGIYCELDESDHCEHITFALNVPEIKEIIRKRRKEGWKLPEV
jgi:Arc/MetJ-type ribon-helix-helix transcriptional regulator